VHGTVCGLVEGILVVFDDCGGSFFYFLKLKFFGVKGVGRNYSAFTDPIS
jgi:hypothetical protein